MYTEDFVDQVGRQRSALIRNTVLIIAVSLAASILVGVFVESWVGFALLALGIILFVGYWGLRGSQVNAYYHYVMEIMQGRHREIEADVLGVSDGPVYKDNKVYYYEIDTLEGELSRTLLWDANFSLPDIQPGQRVGFSVMERYVWDIAR